MSVGTYLSGTGHAALVVWMVVGWGMSSEPVPFEITEVSVVSGAEFAALNQGVQPDLPPSEPAVIEQPEIDETPPAPTIETPPEVAETPPQVEVPAAEMPPVAPDLTLPDTIVTDTPPDIPDTPTIVAPPPSIELGNSSRPIPRPATRVAPETITPPDVDTTVAPDVAQAATDQTEAPVEEIVEPVEETTAPEEATDRIITEAENPTFAPEISRRPATRPQRAAAPVEIPTETPAENAVDPVAAALAAAGATDTPTPTPTPGLGGGDISDGDKANLLRQIGSCWTLGAASTAAMRTSVTVRFSMEAGGALDTSSIQMTSFDGGSASDAQIIFDASRRALIRCNNSGGRQGYDVPAEQFQTRRDLQLVFDPSQMALR